MQVLRTLPDSPRGYLRPDQAVCVDCIGEEHLKRRASESQLGPLLQSIWEHYDNRRTSESYV